MTSEIHTQTAETPDEISEKEIAKTAMDPLQNDDTMARSNELKQRITPFLEKIFERKADRVVALDVGALTSYADVIVVVTATSQRQAAAIADHLYIKMKQQGTLPLGVEGIKEGSWALLDYGDVIIHIFNRETRDFYDIEGLWSDAPQLDLSPFQSATEKVDHGA